MTAKAFGLALLMGALLGACGSGHSCPSDLPDACPPEAPSFKTQVFPLIKLRCQGCHRPITLRDPDLSSYAAIYANREPVFSQVYSCRMPSRGIELTSEERATLLDWLVCGAPDN